MKGSHLKEKHPTKRVLLCSVCKKNRDVKYSVRNVGHYSFRGDWGTSSKGNFFLCFVKSCAETIPPLASEASQKR